MTDKWIGHSKTTLGLVLALLTLWLPQFGISFSPDDGALVGQLADKILVVVQLAFALWGRFVSKTNLVLVPPNGVTAIKDFAA